MVGPQCPILLSWYFNDGLQSTKQLNKPCTKTKHNDEMLFRRSIQPILTFLFMAILSVSNHFLPSKLVVRGFVRQTSTHQFARPKHHYCYVSSSRSFSVGTTTSTTRSGDDKNGVVNKYDRFRNKALTILKNGNDDLNDEPLVSSFSLHDEIAQQAVSLLAQKNKTWKRLSDIIELTSSPLSCSSPPLTKNLPTIQKTIVDIGCDHGLLAIALAVSGRYEKVIGIDVSKNALQGAFEFHEKVMDVLNQQYKDDERDDNEGIHENNFQTLPLEFRLGDGLEPLRPGEADAICIAGMGVENMLSILCNEVDEVESNQKVNYLDYLKNQILYLQPPKNRPKHLIMLYKTMHEKGWSVQDERIVSVNKRWYITSAFVKSSITSSNHDYVLPGHFLSTSPCHKSEFEKYVTHHLKWLDDDLQSKGYITSDEIEWKERFFNDL